MAEDNDVIMYAYTNASKGATLLAEMMGIKKMLHEGSTWIPRKGRTIINWGNGYFPRDNMFRARVINHPKAVMSIINKGDFFDLTKAKPVKAPRVPAFTRDSRVAEELITQGKILVARTILEGSRGEGITILKQGVDFVYAPLYTMYIDKDQEFRVHVVGGKAVFFQQRIKEPGKKQTCEYVRADENGYTMVRRVSPMPQDAIDQSIKAVKFFGLDFGAVDVIVKDDVAYVLEINSAPWMSELCAEAYSERFKEMIEEAA